jgi:ribonucleotide reductase beta subunit family protein with ferritin-like domain
MSLPSPAPTETKGVALDETAYRTRFPRAEEFLTAVQANFWTRDEIVYKEPEDRVAFQKFANEFPGLGRATALALGWFAHADGRVGDNMCDLTEVVPDGALKALLRWNAGVEAAVHAPVYADLVTKVLHTSLDMGEMDRAIGAKVETVRQWLARARTNPALSCFVQAMTEAVCFQTSFLVVQRGRSMGAPACIGDANVLIQRDEFDHVLTGAFIYEAMGWTLSADEATEATEALVAAEDAFVEALFEVPIVGLTRDASLRYVRFIADFVRTRFGLPVLYGVQNPYPDMLVTLMKSRVNYFERTPVVYKKETKALVASSAAFETPVPGRYV